MDLVIQIQAIIMLKRKSSFSEGARMIAGHRQKESIDKIVKSLIADSAVIAVFLKGSIAKEQDDEYSDVDLYCMVTETLMHDFLHRRLMHLEKYKSMVFVEEVNFVAPQIVAVFEDGLHFDLYTVTEKSLVRTGEVKALYDPTQKLRDYQNEGFCIDTESIEQLLDELTFNLLEFDAAYNRNDLIWASRLASHMMGTLSLILRAVKDPQNGKLGMKRLSQYLSDDEHEKLSAIMDGIGPSDLHNGVIQILAFIDELILTYALSMKHEAFYHMMSKQIRESVYENEMVKPSKSE